MSEEYQPRHRMTLGTRVLTMARRVLGHKAAVWIGVVLAAFVLIGTIDNAVNPQQQPQVKVTAPAPTVRVPNVYGMTQADARRLLAVTGFTIGVVAPQKPGEVLWVHGQSPVPGTPVPPGTPVSLSSTSQPVSCGR